jgi:hypothetical protein
MNNQEIIKSGMRNQELQIVTIPESQIPDSQINQFQ